MLSRRHALTLGAATSALGVLSACGPNARDAGADDSSKVRLAWWGNASRDKQTREVVDLFTDSSAEVDIQVEPSEWDAYWDKLATQTAAGDGPDVIQMDEQYLAEYASRGALLDLSDTDLETSGLDQSALDTGTIDEAGLAAVPTGLNAAAVLINPAVFEAAGVAIPDDETWTWKDFLATAEAISAGTDDGVFGTAQLADNPAAFPVWLRQNGAALWTDGAVGFDEPAAQSWFEFVQEVADSPGSPSAEQHVEDSSQGIDQSLFATDAMGMIMTWSSISVNYDSMMDDSTQLLKMPSTSGSAAEAALWYKASMYWAITSSTADQDAAVELVDFFLNDPDAGTIIGFDRGVTSNTDVRDVVLESISEADTKPAEYLDRIADELGEAPDPTPPGGTVYESALSRAAQDLMFDTSDPAAAAKSLFTELSGAVG
ncbi:ABC transporter substrate-binding protein [Brachybacterium tyrofermentans]|uniref:ABC transporter substrate-binding protein n=1 Tax=Brachybacterium tyrofermentans TaxID=47848 RepID=UPI003FD3E3D0